jgi:transposase
VIVLEAAAPTAPLAASEAPVPLQPRRKRSDVTIELGRGRRVRVDSDIDMEALGRILDCVLGRR